MSCLVEWALTRYLTSLAAVSLSAGLRLTTTWARARPLNRRRRCRKAFDRSLNAFLYLLSCLCVRVCAWVVDSLKKKHERNRKNIRRWTRPRSLFAVQTARVSASVDDERRYTHTADSLHFEAIIIKTLRKKIEYDSCNDNTTTTSAAVETQTHEIGCCSCRNSLAWVASHWTTPMGAGCSSFPLFLPSHRDFYLFLSLLRNKNDTYSWSAKWKDKLKVKD